MNVSSSSAIDESNTWTILSSQQEKRRQRPIRFAKSSCSHSTLSGEERSSIAKDPAKSLLPNLPTHNELFLSFLMPYDRILN
jgi:hypothetical protein